MNTPTSDPPKKALLVRCQKCGHIWPMCWTPFPLVQMSAVTPKTCVWCANDTPNSIQFGSNPNGRKQYAIWLETETVRARNDA